MSGVVRTPIKINVAFIQVGKWMISATRPVPAPPGSARGSEVDSDKCIYGAMEPAGSRQVAPASSAGLEVWGGCAAA